MRRPVTAVEGLESRFLLTADLTLTGFSYDFLPPPTQPNVYISHLSITVKNLGTTTVSLTGNHFDLSDNVVIETAFSIDNVLGNIDDFATGSLKISGPDSDNVSISLAPNAEQTFLVTGEVPADPNMQVNYFIAKVDTTGVIAETDEGNNTIPLPRSGGWPPALAGASSRQIGAGGPQVIDPNVHMYALQKLDFDSTSLSVVNQFQARGDVLSIQRATVNGQVLKRSGNKIKFGNEVIGTVSGGKKTEPLEMSFNQNSDSLVINHVLMNVTLKSRKSQTGLRKIRFVFSDGSTSSDHFINLTVV
ncbi:MAG: hypothetical protein KDA68_08470 [Planctomycetaceae bacterium]|nr:hypothetical protein [Planctomycetaceae bacterium]